MVPAEVFIGHVGQIVTLQLVLDKGCCIATLLQEQSREQIVTHILLCSHVALEKE